MVRHRLQGDAIGPTSAQSPPRHALVGAASGGGVLEALLVGG